MESFDALLHTTEYLLGPKGCPWDREQTMKSTRPCVIEEASELVDAIDLEDTDHIREELGDLFFVALFLCKLAEKEGRCSIEEVLQEVNSKLIRRHPHVFGETKLEEQSGTAVLKQWHSIKEKEQEAIPHKQRESTLPAALPALARAQKILKKVKQLPGEMFDASAWQFENEEELGDLLLHLVAIAQKKGLNAEHALRKKSLELELAYGKKK